MEHGGAVFRFQRGKQRHDAVSSMRQQSRNHVERLEERPQLMRIFWILTATQPVQRLVVQANGWYAFQLRQRMGLGHYQHWGDAV